MTLGEKVRYLRVRGKRTQDEVAEYVGVSQPTINRIENDTGVHLPNKELISKLAHMFDVSEMYLLLDIKTLDHLPKHLREFVLDQDNFDAINDAYITTEYLKRKIN